MKKQITLFFALLMATMLNANNIIVTSMNLTNQDLTNHFTIVNFNISWDNSWRATSSAPYNWDAAWVFVKYKVNGNYVSATGATSSGTTITVGSTTGLRVGMPITVTGSSSVFPDGTVVTAIINITDFTVSAAPSPDLTGVSNVITGYAIWEHATIIHGFPIAGSTITTASDNTGVFISRSVDGTGTFSLTDVRLLWDYGINNIADNDIVVVQVYAVEMVYVPQGTFALGSGGSEAGAFYEYPTQTNTYSVSSENAITVGTTTNNLYYPSPSGDYGDQAGPIPGNFPKGYKAFYCMKYEITQQGYVDFLNTLTYKQQETRTEIFITSFNRPPNYSGPDPYLVDFVHQYRFKIKISVPGTVNIMPALYATDYPYVACNCLEWADVAAYLDWSGLRPMTELEFEKVCRGTIAPVTGEYAWGNTGLASSQYTLSHSGANNEVIVNNYSITNGNAACPITASANSSDDGPLRVGIFAGSSGNNGRVTSGATYYGIMEMSGNLWERTVTVGNTTGRAFLGDHGDGTLDNLGNADLSSWPASDNIALGAGIRGGCWGHPIDYMQVSDRTGAVMGNPAMPEKFGGRGVRSLP